MATATLEPKTDEQFLLRDVKIIGTRSRGLKGNIRREYPPQVLREAVPLFEGAPVCLDHDTNSLYGSRPYATRIGFIKNVRFDDSDPNDVGLRGDLQLNPHHALAESVQWDYSHESRKIGLSFFGDGPVQDGKVQKITIVKSVDLVQWPATNESLVESLAEDAAEAAEPEENPHEKRLAAVEASVADHHSRLAECENCLRECMGKAESIEMREKLGTVLSEVSELRKPKAVHIHPNLNKKPTEEDLKAFVRSITRKPL